MSIVVVGLNHKSAPITLFERLSIGDDVLPKALHQLSTYEHVLEGAVLSTCNRTEVYGVVDKFHAGVLDLRNFLSEFCHVAPEDFTDSLYTYHEEAALRHLFRVAAGIDSMVIGESEILGQVRRAYHAAEGEGLVQRTLGRAFRQSLRVGKRARTETAIGRNPVSVSSAAVELAKRAFPNDDLTGKRVAIVGAGKMGRLALRALAVAGVGDVTLINRTETKARDVAARFKVRTRPMEDLGRVLHDADIVISSTTSPHAVIERGLVEAAVARRTDPMPLLIVDIAVPRDVDPSVSEVPGVVLRDLEDLRGVVESSLGSRLGEVGKVERIIFDEVERFSRWERATEFAPTISALLTRAEEIRTAELDRVKNRLRELSPEERSAVEVATKKMMSKLLHEPLSRAKDLASSKQGHRYLAALRELFELDDEPAP